MVDDTEAATDDMTARADEAPEDPGATQKVPRDRLMVELDTLAEKRERHENQIRREEQRIESAVALLSSQLLSVHTAAASNSYTPHPLNVGVIRMAYKAGMETQRIA